MQTTVTVNNRLEIRNVAESILKSIKKATTLDNPVYKDAVKYDRYLGDLSPHIELWEEIRVELRFRADLASNVWICLNGTPLSQNLLTRSGLFLQLIFRFRENFEIIRSGLSKM